MGLKNKLNKMKSFLFDEEDEEKEIKKPAKKISFKENKKLKKEEIDVEDFNTKKIDSIDSDFFKDVPEDKEFNETLKLRTEKKEIAKEKDFSFPEFDEEDFMAEEKKEDIVIEPVIKEKPKTISLYQGSKRKEESKRFRPSPIISPIYGLLDDEGNTVSEEKKESVYNDEVSLDDVRKKAYGSKENLEDTIKKLSTKTIEEAEREAEEREKAEKEKISRAKVKKEKLKEDIKPVKIEKEDEEDDDMILPSINFKEIDVDKDNEEEKKEAAPEQEDDDDDTKEQDLFNLIDTMYQEEGDEE